MASREGAVRCWKRSMIVPDEKFPFYPDLTNVFRTLAGAALLEHGIGPADYKEVLAPDP